MSEDDFEQEENEFGSMDELPSPEDMTSVKHVYSRPGSMGPPTTIPLPQPMLAPSQLCHTQMLSHA